MGLLHQMQKPYPLSGGAFSFEDCSPTDRFAQVIRCTVPDLFHGIWIDDSISLVSSTRGDAAKPTIVGPVACGHAFPPCAAGLRAGEEP